MKEADDPATADTTGDVTPQKPRRLTAEVRELVAIGAAIACNCEMCFKFHYDKARKLGVSEEEMVGAVDTGLMVKNASARSIMDLADMHLKREDGGRCSSTGKTSCCSGKGCH